MLQMWAEDGGQGVGSVGEGAKGEGIVVGECLNLGVEWIGEQCWGIAMTEVAEVK